MEQIPVEVLEMIFDRLPIGQLNKYRRMCKRWQYTIDCLVVYRHFLPLNQTHFPSDERVNLRYCIHLDTFTEESELKKGIYRKFRRIFLYEILVGQV